MTPWKPKCTRCHQATLDVMPPSKDSMLDGGGEDVEATHECRECHNRQRVIPPESFVLRARGLE